MTRKSNILNTPSLLYNIDVVGEKSGKILTKFEKFLNFSVNAICAWSTYLIGILFIITFLFIALIFADVIYNFLEENPIYIIPIAFLVIVRILFFETRER